MKRIAIAAALLCGLATSAQATLYSCSVKGQGVGASWIPEVVMIAVESEERVIVSDTIGAVLNGEPVQGALLNDSNKAFSVAWTVGGLNDSRNQGVKMRYTAILNKGNNSIRLSGKPLGYANQPFVGRGACRVGEIPR
ncbi:MAG: hypothetical protein AAGO57_00895 [Pseudomonadota bacterium]